MTIKWLLMCRYEMFKLIESKKSHICSKTLALCGIWKSQWVSKLLLPSSPQVPQHNQAVLPQGGRRGADVRRHRGGELQGCKAVAHQCPGQTLDPLPLHVESGDNHLALRHWPRDSSVSLVVLPMRDLLVVFQEAAGEGVPILLVGNKMDMDEDRQVSFKDAEQLAHVSSIIFFIYSELHATLTQLFTLLILFRHLV